MFSKIEKFFKQKLYSTEQVRMFCDRGYISKEEFTLITGDSY